MVWGLSERCRNVSCFERGRFAPRGVREKNLSKVRCGASRHILGVHHNRIETGCRPRWQSVRAFSTMTSHIPSCSVGGHPLGRGSHAHARYLEFAHSLLTRTGTVWIPMAAIVFGCRPGTSPFCFFPNANRIEFPTFIYCFPDL